MEKKGLEKLKNKIFEIGKRLINNNLKKEDEKRKRLVL